jgi:hypothetical protein
MRRYVGMLALAIAIAVPAAIPAQADSSRSVTTTTTTTTTREPTGRLIITDMGSRQFRIGDETRVYVAPSDVDLSSLSGRDVKVYVTDDGRVSRVVRSETTTVEHDD